MNIFRVAFVGFIFFADFNFLSPAKFQPEDYYEFLMHIASTQKADDEIEHEIVNKISNLSCTSEKAFVALLDACHDSKDSVSKEFIEQLHPQGLVDAAGKLNNREITNIILQSMVFHAKYESQHTLTQDISVTLALSNFLKFMTQSLVSKTRGSFQETLLYKYKFSFPGYKDLSQLFFETFVEKDYYFISAKEKPFTIDCGSNLGMSLLFFKTIYPKAEIMAFEPSPACLPFLNKNIEDNGLSDVKVVDKVLSDKRGECFFQDVPSFTLCSKIAVDQSKDNNIKVESVLLSEYIKKPVDFLKMDVEGAEVLIFKDLDQSGKINLIKEMVIECHGQIALNVVLDVLNKNGFKVLCREEAIWGHAMLLHAYSKYVTIPKV